MAELNPSNSGKTPLIPATVDGGSTEETAVEIRQSKRRKGCPTFSLLQLNKKIDGQSNSSFNFSFPIDEFSTTTPEVTPKFGSFKPGKEPGHGSSENGHSSQTPVKSKEGITEVEETDKI